MLCFNLAQNVFKISLEISSQDHLWVCVYYPCTWEFSTYNYIINYKFNSIVVWKQTFFCFSTSKFVKVLFMTQNLVLVFHMSLARIYILQLLYKGFYRCWLQTIDWCTVEFNYVLNDFLPARSVHFWQNSAEVSISDCGFMYKYFSLQFYKFWPHTIW